MTYQVREESLENVCHELTQLLQVTRNVPINATRIEWLYRDNPDGPAVIWVVRAPTQELIGFTVGLPRRMVVMGKQHTCWNCADFSVQARYRTLGIAAELRRAATRDVNAGRVAFLYAHPNDRMKIVHERAGHVPVGRMVRFARILHSARHIRNRLSLPKVSAAIAAAVDRFVNIRGSSHRYSSQVAITDKPDFDARFDQLFWSAHSSHQVIGVRDAAYLNWRYRDNPVYATSLCTAERKGTLLGYALFMRQDDVMHVKDIFMAEDETIGADLMAALVAHGLDQKLASISFATLHGNPLIPLLQKFGFLYRPPDTSMFVHVASGDPLRTVLEKPELWYLTVGDRDI